MLSEECTMKYTNSIMMKYERNAVFFMPETNTGNSKIISNRRIYCFPDS